MMTTFLPFLSSRTTEPTAEDKDLMHEAIEQYLQDRRLRFIRGDGPQEAIDDGHATAADVHL